MPATLSRIGATCLLGAGILSCRTADGTGPAFSPDHGPGSVYVLRSVAGAPPPTPLVQREDLTIVVLADTLRLRPDGTGLQGVVERHIDPTTGPAGVILPVERPFTWRKAGNRIEISLDCDDVILRQCLAPPHFAGTHAGSGLALESVLYPRGPLRYERIED